MRRTEIEILDDTLDDDPMPTRAELGLPVDLTRADLEDEEDDGDDLGLRALYAHPEAVLGASWPDAA